MSRQQLTLLIFLFVTLSPLTQAATPKKGDKNSEVVQQQAVDKVNLNTADAATLSAKLNGVGLKKAQAIIEYREKYGLFTDVKQLIEVPGFGESLVSRVIAKLTL
ncbi:helix-hairpin-helix domain-containing protein [Rosenbergiella epipactidis]|uniref:ComEA family DNA-binding protein n=1 Tax=Rosenbergiella epipactidis TaxID=1544694 RepID=UPI001F4D4B72|nr:helix-hairpin-helix domain-containing protein [Rosenbergiella epipactidis]MCL9667227.1 helix-hairpin-helix domain-containing protein [Rosenbergiella epipactidis]